MIQQQFSRLPDITKNLIIINLLMFLATITMGDSIQHYLAIHYIQNPNFQPYQFVTAFFMHANFMHLFFNMFALFMFGNEVEYTLGARKFLFLYLAAGFGANILYMLFNYTQVQQLMANLSPEQIAFATGKLEFIHMDMVNYDVKALSSYWNTPALGASGATYGVLFSFALLYPNRMLLLLIPPIPIKAKYLVMGLAAMEIWYQLSNSNTGIAHMVHLSGAAIAVLLILYWRKKGEVF
jgi:membrane associated rhomboid family serine protease